MLSSCIDRDYQPEDSKGLFAKGRASLIVLHWTQQCDCILWQPAPHGLPKVRSIKTNNLSAAWVGDRFVISRWISSLILKLKSSHLSRKSCRTSTDRSFPVPLLTRSEAATLRLFSLTSQVMMMGKNGRPLVADEDWYSLATLRPSSFSDWKSVYCLKVRDLVLIIMHDGPPENNTRAISGKTRVQTMDSLPVKIIIQEAISGLATYSWKTFSRCSFRCLWYIGCSLGVVASTGSINWWLSISTTWPTPKSPTSTRKTVSLPEPGKPLTQTRGAGIMTLRGPMLVESSFKPGIRVRTLRSSGLETSNFLG